MIAQCVSDIYVSLCVFRANHWSCRMSQQRVQSGWQGGRSLAIKLAKWDETEGINKYLRTDFQLRCSTGSQISSSLLVSINKKLSTWCRWKRGPGDDLQKKEIFHPLYKYQSNIYFIYIAIHWMFNSLDWNRTQVKAVPWATRKKYRTGSGKYDERCLNGFNCFKRRQW